MASRDLAIETIQLTKVFYDWWYRPKVRAVQDLNLKVYQNEIYGFLGPNGSGKTTTIKMLLNLLHPTSGHAFLLSGSSRDPNISARIGYLPEESYLYKYLTAEETLDFYGRIFGISSKIRKARVETLLDMVGLSGASRRVVGTFSKGMMRRIGLAQALINDPTLLILDEPTSGMDPIGTRQIKDLLSDLARRGKTILLCSHLLADVEDVCDRIGILYGGKMQVEGPVQELLQHGDETRITTRRLSRETLQKVRELVQSESDQWDVTAPMEKLESFFMEIVTQAQQKLSTSGAQTGTGISGFLAETPPDPAHTILDSLVEAKVDSEKGRLSDDSTDKPTQVESGRAISTQNHSILDQLTRHEIPGNQEETQTTESPRKSDLPESRREVRRDLLDELTGRKQPSDGETDIPDSPKKRDEDSDA